VSERPLASVDPAIARLLTPEAVRERCGQVLAAAERGETEHFEVDAGRIDAAADYVIGVIRADHPDLVVPYHSRWRHFAPDGWDRWAELAGRLTALSGDEMARVRFDLAVVSVLLDAGAGDAWSWREPESGAAFARSEGLAIASLHAFARGLFSARPDEPLRADAKALATMDARALGEAFQVRDDNPLPGIEGRVLLLNRLGAAIAERPDLFGRAGRVGGLSDHLAGRARDGRLPARAVLIALLDGLGPIWSGRIELQGTPLGDVWRHPAARADDRTDGLVPFHKLSQWLAYSLIEPLQDAGVEVSEPDGLTALAEYRNGGLLIDLGLLVPKHEQVLARAHAPSSEVVVEWRALTVALIDRLAARMRAKLGLSPAQLPLAKVLQGGTWSAGRRIARERRPDGSPPLRLISDGTVF
jgi:Protein of unknown function (DUF1688)